MENFKQVLQEVKDYCSSSKSVYKKLLSEYLEKCSAIDDLFKICTICKVNKKLTNYMPGKKGRKATYSQCRDCVYHKNKYLVINRRMKMGWPIKTRGTYTKRTAQNKPKVNYYQLNKEKRKKYQRNYRKRNRVKCKELQRINYIKNREKISKKYKQQRLLEELNHLLSIDESIEELIEERVELIEELVEEPIEEPIFPLTHQIQLTSEDLQILSNI